MKTLIFLSALFITNQVIDEINVDGECKKQDIVVKLIGEPMELKDVEKKLNTLYDKDIPDTILNEFEELKKAYSGGDRLYEISSERKSWGGLYGFWGYGVVRKKCIVSYIQIIVS